MSAHPQFRRKAGLALAGLIAATLPLAARASTIGLYTDEQGSSCSFSGNNTGLFTAYVVVKPDDRGVRGVRFAAPTPSCLGSMFIEATKPLNGETIGELESGISVAWGTCQTEPALALTVKYNRSGSTEPCCAFAIAEDPYVDMIEAVDCDHASYVLYPITSHFNADASCACDESAPPSPPRLAMPEDGAPATIVSTKLAWMTWSQDTDITSFDLYFGTNPDPAFKMTLTGRSYQPATALQPLTTYYWRVIAHDSDGFESSSPTWTFTTRALNSAPVIAGIVTPQDGATDVPLAAYFEWSSYDVDGDALRHDFYLGTQSDPPPLASGQIDTTFTTSPLDFATTYYWKVVARDNHGHAGEGPVRSFRTRPENLPPYAASLPTPGGNAALQSLSLTLQWMAGDPDAEDELSFDVYFGTSSTPPKVVSAGSSQSLVRSGLSYETRYYWRVVTRDNHGAERSSPVWFFTTRPFNLLPTAPASPKPANNLSGIALSGELKWSCVDPEGDALSYDVYLGTDMSPDLVGQTSTPSYAFGPLVAYTRYYWKVVAKDPKGAEVESPIWSFYTRSTTVGGNKPPLVPSKPSPVNASTNQELDLRLTWSCSEPDGQPLYYDVYFGTGTEPELVASNLTHNFFEPGLLAPNTEYRWKIVARDSRGAVTTGPLWRFETLVVSDFVAVPTDAGVQVKWRLAGTDGLESYTLFRTRLGTTETTMIGQGHVMTTTGSCLDASAQPGIAYNYMLSVISETGEDHQSRVMTRAQSLQLTVHPNYPNPFNPKTTIPYDLPFMGQVEIAIFDAKGRRVRTLVNEMQPDGSHQVVWTGTDNAGESVASGVYFCVLRINQELRTRKLVLLK